MTDAEQLKLLPTFGDDFLPRLKGVGRIMSDPYFAIVELVANAWDAGANEVNITYPLKEGDLFAIEDNGIGMTLEEFRNRWRDLSYNRLKLQGTKVVFPKGSKSKKRTAFGRNGIGRHAMFCFADEYFVETQKDGHTTFASIQRSSGESCFEISIDNHIESSGHGTKIYAVVNRDVLSFSPRQIAEFIGSRFVADPEFKVYVNDEFVTLEDLDHLSESINITLEDGQTILIKRFDSEKAGRTSQQNGIAYWVNKRLVGMPTWKDYDGTLLDARHPEAKRYTYVVEADLLAEEMNKISNIKPDWSGFYESSIVGEVRKAVSQAIKDDLKTLTKDARNERKKAALDANKSTIVKLPTISREFIENFAEEIQINCPTLTSKDLENAVATLAKLEQAKTGYSLLEKLAFLDIHDLDNLYRVLADWSISDAKKVLNEIEWRLKVLIQMQQLIHADSVDELHQLQPLFDTGLWIFGHDYDSIDFSSNRTLSTVIRKMFDPEDVSALKDRPDFVILSRQSSLSVYSREQFNETDKDEVLGMETVVILELKKPGIPISDQQIDQARNYAREIRKKVQRQTKIICYVLGSEVDSQLSLPIQEGNISIHPREYLNIISQANRKLFRLRNHISSFDYIADLLSHQNDEQGNLFDDSNDLEFAG